MDEKIKRLINWSRGIQSPPHTLELWPTFRCNLNCIFCDYRQKREKRDLFINYSGELSTKRWLEIIDEAKKINVREARLVGGGEPLFYRNRAVSMIEKIKSFGMVGDITTNGTLFGEKLVRRLVEIKWDKIEFSIDAPDAETHDYLRGTKGSFKKIINTLKFFSFWKKQFNSNLPKICFSTVVTNKIYDKLEELANLASKFNCDICLLNLTEATKESKSLKLSDKEKSKVLSYLTSGDHHGVSISAGGFLPKKSGKKDKMSFPDLNENMLNFLKSPCFEPWYYMQVVSDGRIGPCCATYCNDDGESMYNKGLMDMWLGEHMNKIRNNLLQKKLDKNCLNCPLELSSRADFIRGQLVKAYFESRQI